MRIGALAAAILLGLATLVNAAPFDPGVVAADAKWVVHLDVDSMRSSAVVKKAYQEFVEKCPIAKIALPMLDNSRTLIGMDPRKDLQGVTLYGSQIGKHEGVLIVFADADRELLTKKVKKAPGYESSTHGSYELHSWTHKDRRGKRPVTGAFYNDKVMVFSGSKAEVKAALNVMAGKTPGLTCKVLAAKVAPGTNVLARAVGIDKVETPCKSKLAKQIESVSIAVGEKNERSFLHVNVVAKSAEVAKQMGQVAEGIRALGMLHAIEHPKDKQLVEGIKVKVAGKTATVKNSAPADAVWQHMKANMKKIAERHRKMHHWRWGKKPRPTEKSEKSKK